MLSNRFQQNDIDFRLINGPDQSIEQFTTIIYLIEKFFSTKMAQQKR